MNSLWTRFINGKESQFIDAVVDSGRGDAYAAGIRNDNLAKNQR